MPSYETLDTIADAYVPLLALITLAYLIGFGLTKNWQGFAKGWLLLLVNLIVAYGLMFIDNALGLWPALGMDYSTHTAVALSFIVALIGLAPRFQLGWVGSFVVYALLMLYQQYHTVADIVTTAMVNLLLTIPWMMLTNKVNPKSQPLTQPATE